MTLLEPSVRTAIIELAAERDDPQLTAFVESYLAEVPDEHLEGSRPDDVFGAALSHFDLLRGRDPSAPAVRVFNPSFEVDGWRSSYSVVHAVTADTPFIVDSVTLAVERAGYSLNRLIHPVIQVSRTDSGTVSELGVSGSPESLVSIEFDKVVDSDRLEALEQDIRQTLLDVAAIVADWQPMLAEANSVAADLDEHAEGAGGGVAHSEAAALLRWLGDANFIFLGYRRYEMVGQSSPDGLALRSVPSTGLGILRTDPDATPTMVRFADLPPEIGSRAVTLNPLHVTKTNGRSTVHRNARMDYVGIKIVSDGAVVGEHRFLGLFTAASYRQPLTEIPVLRRTIAETIAASGYTHGSHNASQLLAAIDLYPRDELFQVEVAELLETTRAIVNLGRRREVAVFSRPEPFGRFVSCLVLLPRDQLTTRLRRRIERILVEAFEGTDVHYTTQVTESAHAQLHYVIAHRRGAASPDIDQVREAIARVAHRWTDELRAALRDSFGDAKGGALHQLYGDAFGPAYTEQYSIRAAVSDITRFESTTDGLGVELSRQLAAAPGRLHLKIHRTDAEVRLSEVLPVLQNLGADVLHEQPHVLELSDGRTIYLYDFGLEVTEVPVDELDETRGRFEEAFLRAWHGDIESDSFNRLILLGGMSWAEVRVVRAYAAYFRQIGARFSPAYVAEALVNNIAITRDLVEAFLVRFDPALGEIERKDRTVAVLARIDEAIENVTDLDEDRILRSARNLIQATVRTSYFQRTDGGEFKSHLTLKFDSRDLADVAPPRPMFETFVFSARTEGIHLRAGEVSRGGIRWSTRLEDYRTEVLGLMATQIAKNAIIVPTGAKGGFIAKRLTATSDRAAVAAEVEACYRIFIAGLLDITDNRIDGTNVGPPDVVAHDEDGSYLVVAADKGTATFSDVANEIALERGFWLGDAFASGGSAGYDHKAMGITARGAWESVTRHFRSLGVDVDRDRFLVVGVGDMSGDVFGNGMLLSRQIALVGAFDHRHVFIDPEPDVTVSWNERQRLFELPGSSWDDYDRTLISSGGGVFSRAAKSVPLTTEIRDLLGIGSDVVAITPNELIHHLLAAEVDLLWNGGIGTFVKASTETHLDAADKVNDGIRVDADQLRCRVVGEGGNLGLTQAARVEFALRGGRVLSDAIDNSAGVSTSDMEVNLKILLDTVVDSGDMTPKQRNELLAAMTDDVAEYVLRGNYAQGRAIENAVAEGFEMVEVHERLIRELTERGLLNPDVERMPDATELAERRAREVGMVAPELSVLLAHTKNALRSELLAADIGSDPSFDGTLLDYFPPVISERYGEAITGHRLRPELVATTVANRTIDRGGVTVVMRLADETGASWADVARAHTAAWDLFSTSELWEDVAALDNVVPSEIQTEILLRGRRLVERSTRWLLRHRRFPIDGISIRHDFGPHVEVVAGIIAEELSEGAQEADDEELARLAAAGVPAELAQRSLANDRLSRALDIIEIGRTRDCSMAEAARLWFVLESRLGLDWLIEAIAGLPRATRWESMARSALRDELSRTHAELTGTVLRATAGSEQVEAEAAVDGWLRANRTEVARLQMLRRAVIDDGGVALEPLTVLLRELRSLAGE